MTSTCLEACIICDIDGFKGRNNSNIPGEAPPGFCTSIVHHMQWIAFIAATPNLKIQITVSNCQINNGLEVGIYEGIDCKNYVLMSECDTDIRPNTSITFSNQKPLTVGQYYYWVMDGNGNDICDYTIKVIEGSTKFLELNTAAKISVPTQLCEKEPVSFSTPGLTGATIYDWYIDDVYVGRGTKFDYRFEKQGEYKVCLEARNACDAAPQACQNVTVRPIKTSTLQREVCFDECYSYLGVEYCKTGKYDIKLKAVNGCDSIVTLDLKVNDLITISKDFKICEGDTLKLGTGRFTTEGMHEAFITDADGCKIKVLVTLALIKCKIRLAARPNNIKCNNAKNGSIDLEVTNGTGPFKYKWTRVENSSISGSGTITKQNDIAKVPNLDEGNYSFELEDDFGNSTVVTVFVSQPTRIKSEEIIKSYNGVNISCFEKSDGEAEAKILGGTPPYSIVWQSGQSTYKVSNLISGIYPYIVKDANDCQYFDTISIVSPLKLKTNVIATNGNCDLKESGTVDASKISGGIKDYTISFNGSTPSNKSVYNLLKQGSYSILATDKNGCTADTTVLIRESIIPEIRIDSLIKVKLGDTRQLQLVSNLKNQEVKWSTKDYLSCDTCNNPILFPLNNTKYTISATSVDGCVRKVDLVVEVIKDYPFVMPNIFTPNNDGKNDFLNYFTDNSGKSVMYINIYDKWGNKIYEILNGMPGYHDLPWDGTFKSRPVQEGSYTWVAKVQYIDDKVITHDGSIAIIR